MIKRITIFLFLLSFNSTLFAQYDSVFVEIDADTVKIWNTEIEENCLFSVEFNVKINNDIITIIEHDTVTDKTTCGCMYDLCVKLRNLETNDYTVNIYRKYSVDYYNNPDSLYYIGTAHFSYQKNNTDTLEAEYYQSKCYYSDLFTDNEIIPDEAFLISSYPNPFNAETTIKLSIPKRSNVKLKLFDMSGKLVKVIASGIVYRGNYIYHFNAENYSSGVYILTLEDDAKFVISKKIILLK